MQLTAKLPNIGLNPDHQIKRDPLYEGPVTKLPYIAPSKNVIAIQTAGAHELNSTYKGCEIPFSYLREHEVEAMLSRISEHRDPCQILIKKVARLAVALKCSEAEAEHLLFEQS